MREKERKEQEGIPYEPRSSTGVEERKPKGPVGSNPRRGGRAGSPQEKSKSNKESISSRINRLVFTRRRKEFMAKMSVKKKKVVLRGGRWR